MDNNRIVVLLNPKSGTQKGGALDTALSGMFHAAGAEADVKLLKKGEHIPDRVRAELAKGPVCIVAGGGDGTICGVAEGMAGSGVPMGVLPLGTFNYFARSLDIPDDIDAAVGLIVNGVARDIRTGTINGRLFLNNTSIGRYPEILATREGVYRRWGRSRIAAYWSVIKTLATLRRPLILTIEADDEVHNLRTPIVFVLNNAFQMEQQGLQGIEALHDGKLVMYLSPDSGRFGMIRHAFALAMGVAVEQRDFHLLTARRFRIESRRKGQRAALDGERLRLKSPFVIEAQDHAISVMVARDYDRGMR